MYHPLTEINQYRDTIQEITEDIKKIYEHNSDEAIEFLWKKLESKNEKKSFRLLVVGQHKRGKSTFINALLGENILPTGILPLTSIITILRYGRKEKAVVLFKNQKSLSISVKDIQKYVTEKENPKNEKGVSWVEIELPSRFLETGIEIIDSPGIGSVYTHNTEETKAFIEEADAFIFLTGGNPPIGEEEVEFLRMIREKAGKIFIIINKIDLFTSRERDLIYDFTKKFIEDNTGMLSPDVYDVSSKQALHGRIYDDYGYLEKSHLLDFEEKLEKFLIYDKSKYILLGIVRIIEQILSQLEVNIKLYQQNQITTTEEMAKKLQMFRDMLSTICEQKEDDLHILKQTFDLTVAKKLDQDIEELKKEELPSLIQSLEKLFRENATLSTKKIMGNALIHIQDLVLKVMKRFKKEEEEQLIKLWQKIDSDILGSKKKVVDMLYQAMYDIFHLQVSPFGMERTIPPSTGFRFVFQDLVVVELKMIEEWFLHRIPHRIIHSYLLKRMKNKLEELFDRQCGLIRYDCISRMQKQFLLLLEDIDETFLTVQNGLLQNMEQLYQQKKKNKRQQKEQSSQWTQDMKQIKGLRNRVSAIKEKLTDDI